MALPTVLAEDVTPFVGAIALAAVLSAEISSADAVLFMLATSGARDFYKGFFRPSASDADVLRIARLVAIGGSIVGYVLTFALDGETPLLAAGRRYADHAVAMSHQAFEVNIGLPRLLRLLNSYSVPATFFVPGFVAERAPDIVRAVEDAGHEVAHHSYSHRRPTELSDEEDRRHDAVPPRLEGVGVVEKCSSRLK